MDEHEMYPDPLPGKDAAGIPEAGAIVKTD